MGGLLEEFMTCKTLFWSFYFATWLATNLGILGLSHYEFIELEYEKKYLVREDIEGDKYGASRQGHSNHR